MRDAAKALLRLLTGATHAALARGAISVPVDMER